MRMLGAALVFLLSYLAYTEGGSLSAGGGSILCCRPFFSIFRWISLTSVLLFCFQHFPVALTEICVVLLSVKMIDLTGQDNVSRRPLKEQALMGITLVEGVSASLVIDHVSFSLEMMDI